MNSQIIDPRLVLARDDDSESISQPPFPPLSMIPTPPPLPFSTLSRDPPTRTPLSRSSQSSLSSTGTSVEVPSSSHTSNDSVATSSHSKLSGGIIGLIVALSILVLILIPICIRMWYIRKRKTRRANMNWSWDNKPNLSMAEKALPSRAIPQDALSISEYSESENEGSRWSHHETKPPVTAGTNHRSPPFDSLHNSHNRGGVGESAPPFPAPAFTRPSLSLELPTTTEMKTATNDATFRSPTSDLSTPVFSVPRVTEAGVPYILATIQRPFIQKLPDELPTRAGQQVGVIRQFDDGWALCVTFNGTSTGPQGMVPTECLRRMSIGSSSATTPVADPSTRPNNATYVNRKSSLFN